MESILYIAESQSITYDGPTRMLESGTGCLYRKLKTAVSVLGSVGAGIGDKLAAGTKLGPA